MPNANSSTVDERIVEMRINNQKFESGAKKTLSTLEKLDDSLNNLGKRRSGGFDSIANSFTGLTNVFNNLGAVADNVLGKISSSIRNLAGELGKYVDMLTIDQINEGWNKYADKTQGVQTIMAATAKDWDDQEAQMEWVNAQLEKLNWFTDETSYNFLDMVNNIGKFTSSGVKLDTAVTAMEGISTWAALSGANTQEASRAMYNLSQAMATGSVKLIDWKSIENANMATLEFKETALETAADLKTLVKVGNGVWRTLSGEEFTTAQFNTQLSEGWFTSEVLLQTLQQYGDFTNVLNEAYDGTGMLTSEILKAIDIYKETGEVVDKRLAPYIERLASDEFELGRRAFKAAQEAKTFAEAINATKDAVSTGWMNIFEKIFGDYLQAKDFWTKVSESLYNIFVEPINDLNSIMDVAFGKDNGLALTTGQQLFTEGLLNILHIFEKINDIVRTALGYIFGDFDEGGLAYLGEILYYSVEKFNRLTKIALNFMDTIADPLSIILAYIFDIVRKGFGFIKDFISPVFSTIKGIIIGLFVIITELYTKLSENGALLVFADVISNIFWTLVSIFDYPLSALRNFMFGVRKAINEVGNVEWIQTISDWLMIIGVYLSDITYKIYEFISTHHLLDYIISGIGIFISGITILFTKIKTAFQSGGILGVLQAIGNKIREFLKDNPLLLRGFEILKTVLGAIVGLVFVAVSSIGSLFTKISFSKLNIPLFEKIKGFFDSVKDVLKLKFSGIISWFESFKHFEIFGRLSEKITKVFDSIKNFFSGLKPDFSGFGSFFASIKDFFSNAFENFFSDTEKIKIAISNFVHAVFQILGETLKNVSLKDIIDVLKIGVLLSRIGRIFTFTTFLVDMKKKLTGIPEALSGMFEDLGSMFENVGKSFQGKYFVNIAVGIALIAAAIYALSTIEENSLMRATAVVAIIGLVLTKMSETIFGKKIYNKQVDIKKFQLVSDMAGVLIGIAFIIGALGYAVGRIAKIGDWRLILASFTVIALLIAEIGVFMVLMMKSFNKIKTNKRIDAISDALLDVGKAMVVMAIAIRLLVKPLLQIAAVLHKYNDDSVGNSFLMITGFAIVLGGVIAGLILIISKMQDITPAKIKALGVTMLQLTASMAIIAVSIRLLTKPLLEIASVIHRYKDNSVGAAAGLIVVFALVLGGIVVGLTYLFAKTKGMTADKINKIGNTILKMAAGIAIMAVGIRLLIKPLGSIAAAIEKYGGWKITGAIIVMAAIIAVLGLMLGATSKKYDPNALLAVGIALALFAASLSLLLPALITFISLATGILRIVTGFGNFLKVLGKLAGLAIVMLVFGAALALFGAGVIAVGVGLLASAASLLIFAAGIYVLVAALDKVGPAMKSFVQGMIDAGSMINKENAADLGKGIASFLALAAAIWLLTSSLGKLDLSKIGNLGKTLGSLAGTLISSIGTIFANIGKAIISHLPSLQTIIVSLITIVGLFAVGAMRPLVNMIGGALISLIANIYLYLHNNRKVIEYYVFGLVAEIMNILNDALTWAFSMIIPSLMQLIVGSIADFLRSIPWFGEDLANSIEGDMGAYAGRIQEKLQHSFSRNENFWQSVNPFGDVPPEVHEVTEEQAASLGIDYKKGIETAKQEISDELASVKEDVMSDVSEAGTDTGDSLVGSLLGELDLKSDDISGAGFNVSSGLANGMLDGSYLVSNASSLLGDTAISGFTNSLEIKSPSRVMAALAAFIPAGIAKGITDNSGEASDSMTILGSAILAAMEEAMARVAMVADDEFEFTPTITPVVDTSNIEGARDNLDWLNAQYAVAAEQQKNARWAVMSGTRDKMLATAGTVNTSANQAMQWNVPWQDASGEQVVSELQFLSGRVDALGEAMTNMKIFLDTGVLVGATSNKMNSALGMMQLRSERGN